MQTVATYVRLAEIEDIKENIIIEDINKIYLCKEESSCKDCMKRINERVQEEILCRFLALSKR